VQLTSTNRPFGLSIELIPRSYQSGHSSSLVTQSISLRILRPIRAVILSDLSPRKRMEGAKDLRLGEGFQKVVGASLQPRSCRCRETIRRCRADVAAGCGQPPAKRLQDQRRTADPSTAEADSGFRLKAPGALRLTP
jgi:hypothetical protein